MTQKELLYVEDAIGHENTTLGILNNMVNSLDDDSIIKFIEKEIKKHTNYKESLLCFLKEVSR